MNDEYTYQADDKKTPLETFEWDNVRWYKPEDIDHKRVLFIGDSISCAAREFVTLKTNEKIYFDGFGTSKGIDNPYFKISLQIFGKQQVRRDAVLFNNGLHGWHLSEDEYAKHYEKMVEFLIKEFSPAKVILLLTTNLISPESEERQNRVIERNNRVIEIANKFNLPVIDLYSISVEISKFHGSDGVHFFKEGNEILAEKIAEEMEKILNKN